MEFEESIFNLIPKEAYVPPKEKRYVSKHDPLKMPTASSFNNFTTSKPGVANIAGHNTNPSGAHTHKASGGTFGLPKGAAKPDASKFRLKNTGNIILPECKFQNHDFQILNQKF